MADQGPPDMDGGGGGESFFTRKVAGLPTWGWLGITAASGIVLLLWWQNRKKNAAVAASAADTSTTSPQVVDSSGIATGQYESLLALLRDLQGQPSEGLPGPAGPQGPPGTPAPLPTPATPGSVSDNSGPSWQNVKKGTVVDDWINTATRDYGKYYGDLVALNPGLPANVSKSKDPRKRVFLYDTAYRVR